MICRLFSLHRVLLYSLLMYQPLQTDRLRRCSPVIDQGPLRMGVSASMEGLDWKRAFGRPRGDSGERPLVEAEWPRGQPKARWRVVTGRVPRHAEFGLVFSYEESLLCMHVRWFGRVSRWLKS